MDGIHDLGGMDGFGPVRVEKAEPVFHAPWEGRVFGMLIALAGAGLTTPDVYRHAVERIDPARYLTAPYYERMLAGVLTLLVERGIVGQDELEARAGGRIPLGRPQAAVVPTPATR